MKTFNYIFIFMLVEFIHCEKESPSSVQKKFDLIEKSKSKKSLRNFSFKFSNKNSTNNVDPILRRPSTPFKFDLSSRIKSLRSNNQTFSEKPLRTNAEIRNSKLLFVRNITIENQCWTQPCLNGASCFGSSYSYYCDCAPGYVGLNCEINAKEKNLCGDGSCFGNGVCSSADDSGKIFKCNCFEEFSGVFCEKRKLDKIKKLKMFSQ